MGVRQNLVDIADPAPAGGGGVVAEQPAARRTAGPER